MLCNLTIDSSNNIVTIDYLSGGQVTGSEHFTFSRMRVESDGWWFDRLFDAPFNNKLLFADIVNYNGAPIGATTQDTITDALWSARS